jgi:hypothetical protein
MMRRQAHDDVPSTAGAQARRVGATACGPLTPTASRQSKCSRPPVILIENGRYLPSLPLAFTIARFFGLKVEDMFG